MESTKFSLNRLDWKKIAKGAAIAAGGAIFTYLESIIATIDFGTYGPIVMAINSIIINLATKFFAGQKSLPTPTPIA